MPGRRTKLNVSPNRLRHETRSLSLVNSDAHGVLDSEAFRQSERKTTVAVVVAL